MENTKKIKIRGQRFFNYLAIISFTILNIIVMGFALHKNTESSGLNNEFSLSFLNLNEDSKEYSKYSESSISHVNEKSTPFVNTVNKAEKIDSAVAETQIIKQLPTKKIVKITKIVLAKKIVTRKRKIEFIEMNSIPALSCSNSLVSLVENNSNPSLILDTFIKQNEIISEAIEVIDSIEITENDTVTKDSTYYVMENKTIAKHEEEPIKKIIPIKWNGQKINWTKKDTAKNKIVSHTKKTFICSKPDTINKIAPTPKGTWAFYKDITNNNGNNRTQQSITEKIKDGNVDPAPIYNIDIQLDSPDNHNRGEKIAPFKWDNNINILFPLLE